MMNRQANLIEFRALEIGDLFTHVGGWFQKINQYQAEMYSFNWGKPSGQIYTFNDREMIGDM